MQNLSLLKRSVIQIEKLVDSLSIWHKQSVLTAIDLGLFPISMTLAMGFRTGFDPLLPTLSTHWDALVLLSAIEIGIFTWMGIYRHVLRAANWDFIYALIKAVVVSSLVGGSLVYWACPSPPEISILINNAILTTLLVVGSRLAIWQTFLAIYRIDNPAPTTLKAVIYGAGSAGCLLAQTLATESKERPIGFVDDDPTLQGRTVQGLTVYAPSELLRLQTEIGFDEVLLAMPSVEGHRKQAILQRVQNLGVPIKTVPTIAEILWGQVAVGSTRELDLEDLLGRKPVTPKMDLLRQDISDRVVLVTGAGGSIGSELCRHIAQQEPRCLLLYELNEYALYQIELELSENYPDLKKVACLGSILDRQYLTQVLSDYQVETIYHAAAYKHVPIVEANPLAGVINNIGGTLAVAESAIACGVDKFVLISTDKAVRPTNIMGTTKRVAELILQGLAEKEGVKTCLTMVRFGNVLGSSGSVIPRFRAQIEAGKSLTVTHKEITRYFMTIPEAATLVIQAGAMAQGGEVFLLDMGEPVKIYELAQQMIRLSGLTPGVDLGVEITGLRPGEKIYEELLIDCDSAQPTRHERVFCAREQKLSWLELAPILERLWLCAQNSDVEGCVAQLQFLVPEYQPVGDFATIASTKGAKIP
jgi:FlaA1/EpsC-like NDP-sugar epimerase